MSESSSSVHDAICNIRAEIGEVPKTGWNDHFGYAYHSEADIVNAVRPLTAKHKLAVMPSVVEWWQNGSGEKALHTLVKLEIELACNGESRSCSWIGEAIDSGDKGFNKAYTSGLKTFLAKLFGVAEGIDSERDSETTAPEDAPPVEVAGQPGPPPPSRAASTQAPTRRRSSSGPSDKQRRLITTLLAEREVPEIRGAQIQARINAGVDMAGASQIIEELMKYPRSEAQTIPGPPEYWADAPPPEEFENDLPF